MTLKQIDDELEAIRIKKDKVEAQISTLNALLIYAPLTRAPINQRTNTDLFDGFLNATQHFGATPNDDGN